VKVRVADGPDADISARPRSTVAPGIVAVSLTAAFAVALLARLLVIWTPGFPDDLDRFVLWAHQIALEPLGDAYSTDISFPPVIVYLWALIGAIEPAIRTVTTSGDPLLRASMKLPASLADLAMAAGVAWWLRDRPWWAVAGFCAIAFNPVVLYVSAWWGQYESLYALAGLVAFLLAATGHPRLAAVALALAVMTKPQAIPFVAPFVGFGLARYGWRTMAVSALVGLAVAVAVWIPFLAADGPTRYLATLGGYQDQTFAVLSLRAWNPWWLLQVAAGGQFLTDSARMLGPLSPRAIGYVLFALVEVFLILVTYRDPRPRTLALALSVSVLAGFVLLTTMHERYAYAAVVFLALLLPERWPRLLWAVLTFTLTLNLVSAVPAPPLVGLIDVGGPIGVLGSAVIAIALLASLEYLRRQSLRGVRLAT
jgi:Gpi18-like mannosyltransferase